MPLNQLCRLIIKFMTAITTPPKIVFKGYNPLVKTLRTPPPRSFRVEIDISDDEYLNVRDINILPEGLYKITIEPVLEE